MKIETLNFCITPLSREVKVRVFTPDSYETGE